MNLKALNIKWALASGAAAAGVVGVVLVLTLTGDGEKQAGAQLADATATPLATLPTGTRESTLLPGATEAIGTPVSTRPPIHIPTLPPDFTLTEKRPCPDEWQRASDDVLNYSICIPPDWGIMDDSTGERSTRLTLGNEHWRISSPEGFPYPAGVPTYKPFQYPDPQKNPDITLISMSFGPAIPNYSWTDCELTPLGPSGSLPAAGCQSRFDYLKDGAVEDRHDGSMIVMDVVVPLPSPEPNPMESRVGYGLFITILGNAKAMAAYGSTISQILDTLEGQP